MITSAEAHAAPVALRKSATATPIVKPVTKPLVYQPPSALDEAMHPKPFVVDPIKQQALNDAKQRIQDGNQVLCYDDHVLTDKALKSLTFVSAPTPPAPAPNPLHQGPLAGGIATLSVSANSGPWFGAEAHWTGGADEAGVFTTSGMTLRVGSDSFGPVIQNGQLTWFRETDTVPIMPGVGGSAGIGPILRYPAGDGVIGRDIVGAQDLQIGAEGVGYSTGRTGGVLLGGIDMAVGSTGGQ